MKGMAAWQVVPGSKQCYTPPHDAHEPPSGKTDDIRSCYRNKRPPFKTKDAGYSSHRGDAVCRAGGHL
eukprot:681528-Pelagomonas_calceolata.AAC.3